MDFPHIRRFPDRVAGRGYVVCNTTSKRHYTLLGGSYLDIYNNHPIQDIEVVCSVCTKNFPLLPNKSLLYYWFIIIHQYDTREFCLPTCIIDRLFYSAYRHVQPAIMQHYDNTDGEKRLSKKTSKKVILIRAALVFVLLSLVAGFGAAAFLVLRGIEINNFEEQYDSSVAQITQGISNALNAKITAASMANNIYAYAIQSGYAGKMPYLTLPGYEYIFNDLNTLAENRGADFDPLVTLGERKQWEAWACSQTRDGALGKEPGLTKRATPTSRVVCDGIYNQTSHGAVNDTGYNYGSQHPTWMFPGELGVFCLYDERCHAAEFLSTVSSFLLRCVLYCAIPFQFHILFSSMANLPHRGRIPSSHAQPL